MASRFALGQGQAVSNSNYQVAMKNFFKRGGFSNGMNPTLIGKIYYVNTNTDGDQRTKRGAVGSDSNVGSSPIAPFATVARAFTFLHSYDVLVINGVVREQVVTPSNVFNVTIVGGANNTPRQATSGGVATGGGASWLPPLAPTALRPLLEITSAGWTLANIQMSPTTNSACVRLTRSGTVDIIDASHTRFENMYFSGGGTGPIGIEDNGGCGFVEVQDCRFQNLTSAILSLTTAAAIPLSWRIMGNRFQQNVNDVKMSLSHAIITYNEFMTAGVGATNKVISTTFIGGQGNNNHVTHNVFTNTGAQVANASGYTAGAADIWADNYCSDAVDYGIPA